LKKTVVTHNGVFHADEVLAIALIKTFAFTKDTNTNTKIIRTRDPKVIITANIVIDVGGVYKSDSSHQYGGDYMSMVFYQKFDFKGRFDHHQFSQNDENFGKSSAGLVWEELTSEIHSYCEMGTMPYGTKHIVADDFPTIQKLVSIVDKHDTGIENGSNHPFIKNIVDLNDPDDIYCQQQEVNFLLAVEYAMEYLNSIMNTDSDVLLSSKFSNTVSKNNLRRIEIKKDQKTLVNTSKVVTYKNVNTIVLPKGSIFVPANMFIGSSDFLIFWDSGQNCWTVQTVPLDKDEFGSKFILEPTKDSLEIFCHKAGFITKVKPKPYGICINGSDGFTDSVTFNVTGIGKIAISVGETYYR